MWLRSVVAQVFFDAMAKEGLNVCTPIDLSRSEHFDLRDLRLIDWIFYMILTRRFRAVLCEPTCTTFSPADRMTSRLDLIGSIPRPSLVTCWQSDVWRLCGMRLDMVFSSSLTSAWLSIWRFLLQIGFSEAVVDSCVFGSIIHRKPFRLLCHGLHG